MAASDEAGVQRIGDEPRELEPGMYWWPAADRTAGVVPDLVRLLRRGLDKVRAIVSRNRGQAAERRRA